MFYLHMLTWKRGIRIAGIKNTHTGFEITQCSLFKKNSNWKSEFF